MPGMKCSRQPCLTILILGREEECPEMIGMLRSQFSGFEIVEAHDTRGAVSLLDDMPVDCVLVARSAARGADWTAGVRSWMERRPELAGVPFLMPGDGNRTLH